MILLLNLVIVRVLENKFFLPLGFTYEQYIPANIFSKLYPLYKDVVLHKAFVAENPINDKIKTLKEYDLNEASLANYSLLNLAMDISLLKQNTFNILHFSQNKIIGDIVLIKPKLLFFSIPFDSGWHAVIDGKNVKPLLCNIGFMGFLLNPGHHNIELFFKPPFFLLTLIISIVGIIILFSLIIKDLFLHKN